MIVKRVFDLGNMRAILLMCRNCRHILPIHHFAVIELQERQQIQPAGPMRIIP
jgi:hypothetical protein